MNSFVCLLPVNEIDRMMYFEVSEEMESVCENEFPETEINANEKRCRMKKQDLSQGNAIRIRRYRKGF